MKKLLTALLLTLVLAFTYSCSDSAGDSAGGPDTNPDPEKPIPGTKTPWTNIKFLDNVTIPAPKGITIADNVVTDSTTGSLEVIINDYTYDNFKTYVKSLKADGGAYNAKTHTMVDLVLGGEKVLLPATLEDTKSTSFVFDNDTHYTKITFYGDNYTGTKAATHNLSIKSTKTDPFSKIGGKVVVMEDVPWRDILFISSVPLPKPAKSIGSKSYIIYDNATDKQEMTIHIRTMETSTYTTYVNDMIIKDTTNFTRHKAIPATASMAIGYLERENQSAAWVVTDAGGKYINIAYAGFDSEAFQNTKSMFTITISTEDPFAKGESTVKEDLSLTDAIAEIAPTTTFPELLMITGLGSTGKVVTYNDTKYGKEIKFEVDDIAANYKLFRDYLGKGGTFQPPTSGLTAEAFVGKSHPKSLPMGLGMGFAFAVPAAHANDLTAAWAFIDEESAEGVRTYISFIWHGKNSPNNPNNNGKAIFIIERMTFDPMWFMPLAKHL